ncbi:MAG TPA: glycosyltransferase family 4 protein [Thermoplasmata archaeon]|nr:glycosyltransferase family 4 protein [Thermoplasmata archaeon]
MRILLVGTGVQPIPPTGYGGVERTIAEFAAALRAAGESVEVLNDAGHGRSWEEYRFAIGLPRRVRAAGADVVHASTPVVANRLALAGVPFVYTTHSRHWFEWRGVRQRFGRYLERRAVARATATIALTDRLAASIERQTRGRPPRRLVVIPIGVDTDRFRPAWDRRTGRRVLGVGVVRPFKRWELAARALRGSGATLTIVGPTPDPAYAARVRAAGEGVELTGEIGDDALAARFAEADLLIHPSRVELLAGAVLQGLAAGLPVLGADPIASLLDPGRTGWTAAPGADDADLETGLAREAHRLLGDAGARRAMGEAARRSAIDRFSWAKVVADHRALYRELAAGPAGAGAATRR